MIRLHKLSYIIANIINSIFGKIVDPTLVLQGKFLKDIIWKVLSFNFKNHYSM
jgi:hypothetical protein